MHIAKELAYELKKRGINCISNQGLIAERLKFYGIDNCGEYQLIEQDLDNNEKNNVTISYKYRPIYKAIVTNINTQ